MARKVLTGSLNSHARMSDDNDLNNHYPYGFGSAIPNTAPVVDETDNLKWEDRYSLPTALSIADSRIAPPTENNGDVYILDFSGNTFEIDSITWQSGNTIRYTFAGGTSFSPAAVGDYINITGCTNSVNNGTFEIVALSGLDIDITNTLRSSSDDDEATTPGQATITHANWDGALQGDWVRYNETDDAWGNITPKAGFTCYVKDVDALYNYDGTAWVAPELLIKATTTGITFSTIATIPIRLSSTFGIRAEILGRKDDTKHAYYLSTCLGYNKGGGVVKEGDTTPVAIETDATWDIQWVTSGGNILLQAHGNTGSDETVYWTVKISFITAV